MHIPETKIIDLGEATALFTVGFSLIKLEPTTNGKHKIFIFESTHPTQSVSIDETLDLYRRRKLQIDAYTFYRSIKELKNSIHERNEIEKI